MGAVGAVALVSTVLAVRAKALMTAVVQEVTAVLVAVVVVGGAAARQDEDAAHRAGDGCRPAPSAPRRQSRPSCPDLG